ncbi:MAG: DnaJ C-terminal domain-containing protein, partial [Candidatus Gastranaerophilales bacterium]|nr:DnaJ C-terminal domain-containing protein [Candidatus Gastranaerophilales bacterium]
FSEFMDGLFKKSADGAYTKTYPKGDDITVDINISITEAHNGTTRQINVLNTTPCPGCNGIKGKKCSICDGKGETSSHHKLNVKIPPNVKEGSKIRLPEEGNKSTKGGNNGDLYLIIHIQKQSFLKFEGLNIYCDLPITPTEAALGASIEIPSVNETVKLTIPSETQSGQKFRLNGQGTIGEKTGKRGDFIITVRIEIPKKLSNKERELYQELARVRKFNPRENLVYEQTNKTN